MRDPAGTVAGLNLYEYARANSVAVVDLLGLDTDMGDILWQAHVAENRYREGRRIACRAGWTSLVTAAHAGLDIERHRITIAAAVVAGAVGYSILTYPEAVLKAMVTLSLSHFTLRGTTGIDGSGSMYITGVSIYKWYRNRQMSTAEYYATRHWELDEALEHQKAECDQKWAPLPWDPPENDGCGTMGRVAVHGNLFAQVAPLGFGLVAILLWWLRNRRRTFFVSWAVKRFPRQK